jgi:hypothetical protein
MSLKLRRHKPRRPSLFSRWGRSPLSTMVARLRGCQQDPGVAELTMLPINPGAGMPGSTQERIRSCFPKV